MDFFSAVDQAVGLVAGADEILLLLVVGRMGFGFLHQLFDVGIGEAGRSGDLDGLLLARAEILGGHVHDAVGVDVEGHFNLRHAARCRRNAGQVETGQRHVVGGHRTFALQHVDGHGGLVVRGGRKGLALCGSGWSYCGRSAW